MSFITSQTVPLSLNVISYFCASHLSFSTYQNTPQALGFSSSRLQHHETHTHMVPDSPLSNPATQTQQHSNCSKQKRSPTKTSQSPRHPGPTGKYLLAMTFVYFKRAHFTIAEYTRRNFFIALYLANTMEEDEEESKYEIFPWALGENWQKRFPRFLKQRDKLWGRIQYRAAVSRRCCEEVMAIVPSHSVWLRERSEHHSGARRHYGNRDDVNIPRGPSASPVYCALCNCSGRLRQGLGSSSPCKGFSVQTQNNTYPDPFPSFQTTETTPPRDRALYRKRVGTKSPMQYSSCCCTEEVLSKYHNGHGCLKQPQLAKKNNTTTVKSQTWRTKITLTLTLYFQKAS
uniref:Speedy/RINGO cell cycle regulator family member A n=1 Tax=Echeneis naucrates TaxID=173247 RepID=A0A665V8M7_ECHNA